MKIMRLDESFNLSEDLLLEGPLDRLVSKEQKFDNKVKKQQKKGEKIIAKDLTSVCAKATFYINNKYDKGKTQAQWRQYLTDETKKINDEKDEDKKAAKQKAFDASVYNAIVVDAEGFYIRRGAEWLVHSGEQFVPGKNDKIAAGYFIEPYKYGGTGGARKPAAPKDPTATPRSGAKRGGVTETNFKSFVELAKLLNVGIFDQEKKQVPYDKMTFDQINNYSIKMGSATLTVEEWIKAVKKNKLLK